MLANSRSRPGAARRKSPVQARSRATVATIMEAAAHVLQRRGYPGFTTNHVALRAGVSIGSIYQYFPDKDALLAAMVIQDIALTEQAMLAALRELRGSDPLSAGWCQQLLRAWYSTHAAPHQHALYALAPTLPGVRARAELSLGLLVGEVAAQLARRGVKEAALRAQTLLLIAMGLVHELVIALPSGRARQRAQREALLAMSAYLRAVAPARASSP